MNVSLRLRFVYMLRLLRPLMEKGGRVHMYLNVDQTIDRITKTTIEIVS